MAACALTTVAVVEACFAGIPWRHGDVAATRGNPRRALRDAGTGRRSSWRHNDVIGVDLREHAGGGWRQSCRRWDVHLLAVYFHRSHIVDSRLFKRLYRYDCLSVSLLVACVNVIDWLRERLDAWSRGRAWWKQDHNDKTNTKRLIPRPRLVEQQQDCRYTLSQKTRQLWNGISQNYNDRFWWRLAEIFKIL